MERSKSNLKIEYDIVILTHMPHDSIIFSIEKLLTQTIKPTKIVVYNTDESELYKNISNKILFENLLKNDIVKLVNIEKNSFDHGKARNDASKFCHSPYILFMTDDAVPYDEFLAENLLSAFSKIDDLAVTNARQMPRPSASLIEKISREYNYPNYDILKDKTTEKKYGIKNYYCSNVCAMFKKDIFDSLGKFEENIILNEDTFFAYKAISSGYKVLYNSKAKVYHSHSYSNKEQFSRNFDIGVSQSEKSEIFDKIPSMKSGREFAENVFFKLLMLGHPILSVEFLVECTYKYFGFKNGRNFKKLSIDKCIKYASNKTYFVNKKE